MPQVTNRRVEAAADDPEALVELLIEAGKQLPPRLRRQILALGPAAVPPLLALFQDRALALEEAPGEGWGPIHAAELLGELRAPEAIEPMLRLLEENDWDTILHDTVLRTLPLYGGAAFEPTLAAYEAAADPEVRGSFTSVLARLGIRDDRIYDALIEELNRDVVMGAGHFTEYRDPRVLPLLFEMLDRYESQGDKPFANQELIEVVGAIEELGGELTPEQREKVDRILAPEMANRRAWAAMLERSGRGAGSRPLAARKVGRNDPCPCGSGKKYKKCCLGKEAA
jgi:hypothetical protein